METRPPAGAGARNFCIGVVFLLRAGSATAPRRERSMKYKCPHCHSNTFRLLLDAGGRSVAQCLYCGEASSFTVTSLLEASGRTRVAQTVPAQYPLRDVRHRRSNGRKRAPI
jgi:hypothetical protein